ncbi:conserved hypothetical protein [Ricinus communis]|uniref:Uncharacterized protein n=1 Tax=Ricinus communis TaxID=3988 RepID=B9TKE2_RICCO|nr:conserved hypothetical protein [Ricinus communis]
MLAAKIVQRDLIAPIAVVIDRLCQLSIHLHRAFQNFDHHLLRRYGVSVQDALKYLAVGINADQQLGMYVEEQQPLFRRQMQVVKRMQRPRHPVELDQPALIVGKAEGEDRAHRILLADGRPQQSLKTIRFIMLSGLVNRLKRATQLQADVFADHLVTLGAQAQLIQVEIERILEGFL